MTPEEEKYVQLLKSHDWYYDYSDDHRVWRAGSAAYSQLRGMQKNLDPQGEIWNKYAPDDYKIKPPAPADINPLPPVNVKKRGNGPAP
jgi:hypothetical protein